MLQLAQKENSKPTYQNIYDSQKGRKTRDKDNMELK
jgi:hypothetical protein